MEKNSTLESLKSAHKELKDLIDNLSFEQKQQPITPEGWTVKEILAHLASWHWEYIKEIDRIIHDRATWHKSYESHGGEDEFNRQAVESKKGETLEKIYQEWEDSFRVFIQRVEQLTNEEWIHRSDGDTWSDGIPVSVESLFVYEYKGLPHEAGHAKQIRETLA